MKDCFLSAAQEKLAIFATVKLIFEFGI